MAIFLFTPRGRTLAAALATRVWRDLRDAVRHPACLAVLALGLCSLGLGFALESDRPPTTRFMLEAIEWYFGLFAGLAIVVGNAILGPTGPGHRVLARFVALALLAVACWSAAGLAAKAFQLPHGQKPELALYAVGLYVNLGWNTLHLAALAVFAQVAMRRRWLAAAATAAIYAVSNLAFEHPLLRFGTPILVWSDMNGYGQARNWQLAAGLYWTAICALLLVAAHFLARRHTQWRRRLSLLARGTPSRTLAQGSTNTGATAWASVVTAATVASWVLLNKAPTLDHPRTDGPAPSYSRLDLGVDIFPYHLDLTSGGKAVVVNRHDVAIPDILFTLPKPLVFIDLSLTGKLLEDGPNWRRYRLNRPLEPQETLRFDFQAHWPTAPLPSLNDESKLHVNGTSLRIADLVPVLGEGRQRGAVPLRLRLGTALDQVAVAPGQMTRTWREEGRRYFEYGLPQPVSLAASVHFGRYEVAQANCDDTEVEVFVHPSHQPAAPRLLSAACEAMRHAPGIDLRGTVRIVETPDYVRSNPWREFSGASRLVPSAQLAQAIVGAPTGVLPYSEIEVARFLARSAVMLEAEESP